MTSDEKLELLDTIEELEIALADCQSRLTGVEGKTYEIINQPRKANQREYVMQLGELNAADKINEILSPSFACPGCQEKLERIRFGDEVVEGLESRLGVIKEALNHDGNVETTDDFRICRAALLDLVAALDGDFACPGCDQLKRDHIEVVNYWRKRTDTILDREAEKDGRLVHVYNAGYMAGHHDTVEATFIDIHQSDMDTYHSDVVAELNAALAENEEGKS